MEYVLIIGFGIIIIILLLLFKKICIRVKNNYLTILSEYKELNNKKDILEKEIKAQKEIEQNLKNSCDILNTNFYQMQELKLKELNNYLEKEKNEKEHLLIQQIQSLKDELIFIENRLKEAKQTQNIINTKIRERKIEEEEINFHKIQISDSDLEDIKILLEVKERLKNNKLLDKIIYDNYISKNTTEMCKECLTTKNLLAFIK